MRAIAPGTVLVALAGLLAAQDEPPALVLLEHVQVALVAEHEALVPGSEQWVGLTLTLEPGWHTYWLNPGDSGLPIDLSVQASPGATLGEPLYPAPQRYVQADGERVDFVYPDAVTVLVPITVSAEQPPERVELRAQASWLVCQDACVGGAAELALTLPVRPDRGSTTPAAPGFAASRARLPGPAPAGLSARWEDRTLVVELPGAEGLVAFPLTPDAYPPEDLARSGVTAGDVLRLAYPARLPPGVPVQLLLEVHRQGRVSFHWVATATPAPPD